MIDFFPSMQDVFLNLSESANYNWFLSFELFLFSLLPICYLCLSFFSCFCSIHRPWCLLFAHIYQWRTKWINIGDLFWFSLLLHYSPLSDCADYSTIYVEGHVHWQIHSVFCSPYLPVRKREEEWELCHYKGNSIHLCDAFLGADLSYDSHCLS